jgi:hypothetical protein
MRKFWTANVPDGRCPATNAAGASHLPPTGAACPTLNNDRSAHTGTDPRLVTTAPAPEPPIERSTARAAKQGSGAERPEDAQLAKLGHRLFAHFL